MKRCVIFDMDGVIINSEPIHQKCERQMFDLFGIEVSDKEHDAFKGTTDRSMWSTLDDLYRLPLGVTEAILLKTKLYIELLNDEPSLEPVPYVREFIAELSRVGFQLALASSSPHAQIEYILERLKLKHYFMTVTSGEDVVTGKPHPAIFLKSAGSLGLSPDQCIVIEDSNNGVRAANNAGMKCIGFLNPQSGSQDLIKADCLIHSFNELSPQIIESFF